MADFKQDPASTCTYKFDRSVYLAPPAKITASTWEVPDPLQKTDDKFDDASTQVSLTGGEKNITYAIYNTFTSDDGQVQRLAFSLLVVDAAFIRDPTALEKRLDEVRVALGTKAANDTYEYRIATRLKRAYTFDELLNYEKRLTEQVNQERLRLQREAGLSTGVFKNHEVWMVEP